MRIAVWYHCLISGPRIPSGDNAIAILSDQMNALNLSGLAGAADEIHVGVNGPDGDALTVCTFTPEKTILHVNPNGETELATLRILQEWLTPGWAVFYHHIKAIQYPLRDVRHSWRKRMEVVCVWNWMLCVEKLRQGYDTCGARWHTPNRMQRYWAGNFWWSTSDYLMKLPELPADEHSARYESEVWIGKSEKHPRAHDFQPSMKLF